MKNSKNTKRALFASVLSMILCIAMLVGSTFAWFTDSVTSGQNKIVAGNLDIELEYTTDFNTWKTVQDAKELFQKDARWEPGHAEVVYLRINNLGSLALKYKFALNIDAETKATNVNGEEFALSNHLEYGVVEDQKEKFVDRAAAIEAVENPTALTAYSKEGKMIAGAEKQYLAIVVYMPKEVGNEANYRGDAVPAIDLSLSLLATQDTIEKDSFGNTYDESASWPVEVENSKELLEALTAGGTVVLTQDITIESAAFNSLVIDKDTILQLEDHHLNVTGIGTAEKQKILVNNGATLIIDGKETGSISYAAADTNPRLFSVENGSKLVINGGNFNIQKTDSRSDAQGVYLDEGCAFEMNGGKITADKGTALNIAGKNCKVIINGGTLLSRGGNQAVTMSVGSTLVMNGGKVLIENETNAFSSAFSGSMNAGEITINDGTISGPIAFNLAKNQKITVNGGTIESARLNYGSKSGSLLTVNDGTIIGTGTDDENNPNPAVVLDIGNVELRGGTYTPNYLYARNGASVTLFEAVYNGTNPPAYGTDDNSTITFGQ